MSAREEFREALAQGDYMLAWGLWAQVMPHLPRPSTPAQAEIIMHRARTETETLSLKARVYSHKWLSERAFPSGLPDRLKASADRLYPTVVPGVGIAVKMPVMLREVGRAVQRAMSDAVSELHADGVDLADRAKLHPRMFEAREATLKTFLGGSAHRLSMKGL